MNYFKFSKDKLSVGEIYDLVSSRSPFHHITHMFIGPATDNLEGKEVLSLAYEANESVALNFFENTATVVRKQWQSVENIAIYHRLGNVCVNEVGIVIAISSPYKDDLVKAVEWCSNTIGSSAPIHKKRIYETSMVKENNEVASYPPKRKLFNTLIEKDLQRDSMPIPPHLVQIKATKSEIDQRIENFMTRKKSEVNAANIREFCNNGNSTEFSCARVDAVFQRREGSKSHLEVHRVLNALHHRDQTTGDYQRKYMLPDGVEQRIQNLESQLCCPSPTNQNLHKRLKTIEDRVVHMESLSQDYIQFWDKTKKPVKKHIFTIEEIDELILAHKKKMETSKTSPMAIDS